MRTKDKVILFFAFIGSYVLVFSIVSKIISGKWLFIL